MQFLQGGAVPDGCAAADKVVGRATAYLYVLLKVKAVYARVISEPAVRVLEGHNITVSYGTAVPNIINRKGDGICSFEAAVMEIQAPQTACAAILEKMREMNISL